MKENRKKYLCVPCCKNKILHGVSDYYGKNIDQMTSKINNKSYGGGYRYFHDFSLSETQIMRKYTLINGIMIKDVSNVDHAMKTYEKLNDNINHDVFGIINMNDEGSL